MSDSLSAWVPGQVLVGALAMAIGALYKLVLDRAKRTDDKLEKLVGSINALELKFAATASLEQLGRMGDRFDARYTALAQDLAVTKAVSERFRNDV